MIGIRAIRAASDGCRLVKVPSDVTVLKPSLMAAKQGKDSPIPPKIKYVHNEKNNNDIVIELC